jgi:hypothetical protein
MLETQDDRHIEENIYLIDSANRIYVARIRWKSVILEAINGEAKNEYPFRAVEIKGGY